MDRLTYVSLVAIRNPEEGMHNLWLHGLRNDDLKWSISGGHALSGETAEETAVRELSEEVGLQVHPDELKFLRQEHHHTNQGEVIVSLFETNYPHNFKFNEVHDPDREFKEVRWLDPLRNTSNLHAPPDRNILIHYLEGKPIERDDYATIAGKQLALMYPVAIGMKRNFHKDIPYHISLKVFDGDEDDQGILDLIAHDDLTAPQPKNLTLSPIKLGDHFALEVKGIPQGIKWAHNHLIGIGHDFAKFTPHITIPEDMWHELAAHGKDISAHAIGLKVFPLELRQGSKVLHRWKTMDELKARDELFDKSEDLGKVDWGHNTFYHGFIHPNGKWEPISSGTDHVQHWEDNYQGLPKEDEYISLGHAGQSAIGIPTKLRSQPLHPAMIQLRNMLQSHLEGRSGFADKDPSHFELYGEGDIDTSHFVRHGILKGTEFNGKDKIFKAESVSGDIHAVAASEEVNPLMNRVEDKYMVHRKNQAQLIDTLKAKLKEGDSDTEVRYNVNKSIYFDSRDLDAFRDNLEHIKPRFKVRIRQYAPNGDAWEKVAYIEVKFKDEKGITRKVRIRIKDTGIESFIKTNKVKVSDDLVNLNKDITKEALEKRILLINTIMERYGFRKQCVITYERRAYSNKDIRVTVDENIRYHEMTPVSTDIKKMIKQSEEWHGFKHSYHIGRNRDILIVEVKHQEERPKWIKELLDTVHAHEAKFSKYCASIVNSFIYDHKGKGPITKPRRIDADSVLRSIGGYRTFFKSELQKSMPGQNYQFNDVEELQNHLKTKPFTFITGYASTRSPEENAEKHADLKRDLISQGKHVTDVMGQWGGYSEPSFMVHDLPKADAVALGQKYGQMAVIHGENGQHEEISTHSSYTAQGRGIGHKIDPELKDNYSEFKLKNGHTAKVRLNFGGLGSLKKWQRDADNPLHGVISPKGEFHSIPAHMTHEHALEDLSGVSIPDAFEAGWVGVGHNGENVHAGQALANPNHPATMKLRQMIGQHGFGDLVYLDTRGAGPTGHFSMKHFVNQGALAPHNPLIKADQYFQSLRKAKIKPLPVPRMPKKPEPIQDHDVFTDQGKHVLRRPVGEFLTGPQKGKQFRFRTQNPKVDTRAHFGQYVDIPKTDPRDATQGIVHDRVEEGKKYWTIKQSGKKIKIDHGLRGFVDATEHSTPWMRTPDQQKTFHGLNFAKFQPLNAGSLTQDYGTIGTMKNFEGKKHLVKSPIPLSDIGGRGDVGRMEIPHREAAFYDVAKNFFGLGKHVPPTGLFHHPTTGGPWSSQEWQQGAHPFKHAVQKKQAASLNAMGKQFANGTLHKLGLMDMILGNSDRHSKNFLISPKGVHLIDNGFAWTFDQAGMKEYGHEFPQYLATHKLADLDPKYTTALAAHPSGPDIYGMHPAAKKWLLSLNPLKMRKSMKQAGVDELSIGRSLKVLNKAKQLLRKHPDMGFDNLFNHLSSISHSDRTSRLSEDRSSQGYSSSPASRSSVVPSGTPTETASALTSNALRQQRANEQAGISTEKKTGTQTKAQLNQIQQIFDKVLSNAKKIK